MKLIIPSFILNPFAEKPGVLRLRRAGIVFINATILFRAFSCFIIPEFINIFPKIE